MEKKQESLFKRLSARYRVNIINPENFEEVSSFNGSWLQVLMVFSVLFMLGFGLSILLLAYTPLNAYFISSDKLHRADPRTIELSLMADSLQRQLALQKQFADNQLKIMRGNDEEYANDGQEGATSDESGVDESDLFYVSPEDSALRKEMESDLFKSNNPEPNKGALHFYPPVDGIVVSGYDAAARHYAIDLVADSDAPVKAVLDGSVIFSEFSSSTGHVVMVQHRSDIISVYKHNSVILKPTGSYVRAGETIAIIGNSGEHSSGPHLHFELWQRGQPLNPEDFINF